MDEQSAVTATTTRTVLLLLESQEPSSGPHLPHDHLIRLGLEVLREADRAPGATSSRRDMQYQLAHVRAMMEIMLLDAASLRSRVLEAERAIEQENERAGRVQREFRALQDEARKRDSSLLNLSRAADERRT